MPEMKRCRYCGGILIKKKCTPSNSPEWIMKFGDRIEGPFWLHQCPDCMYEETKVIEPERYIVTLENKKVNRIITKRKRYEVALREARKMHKMLKKLKMEHTEIVISKDYGNIVDDFSEEIIKPIPCLRIEISGLEYKINMATFITDVENKLLQALYKSD